MKSLPRKVTVICLGNICRSPVGELLLKKYAKASKQSNLNKIEFDSAGLQGGYMQMHRFSQEFLQSQGIDISHFISKATSVEYFSQFDLILVLEAYMRDEILRLFHTYHVKSEKIPKIQTLTEAAGSQGDVEDPYGLPKKHYLEILYQIDDYVQKIIENWSKL